MMLSECKKFLWLCTAITAGAALLSVALSIALLIRKHSTLGMEQTVISLVFLVFLCFLLAMLLLSEFTRVSRADAPSWQARSADLQGKEVASLTRHCPGWLRKTSLLGIALGGIQIFITGDVDASLNQGMSPRELRGLLAGATLFYCLALPVIASAAAMEGGYGD